MDKQPIDEDYHRHNSPVIFEETSTRAKKGLHQITKSMVDINLDNEISYLSGNCNGNLEEVIDNIENAEKVNARFMKVDYPDQWYLSKSLHIQRTARRLDDYLQQRWEDLAKEFTANLQALRKSKDNLSASESLREKLNRLWEESLVIFNHAQGREIPTELSEEIQNYTQKKEIYQKYQKQISLLYEKYFSIPHSETPIEELKLLKKEVKRKFFRGLRRDCLKDEFFEGALYLKELERRVDHSLKNKKTMGDDGPDYLNDKYLLRDKVIYIAREGMRYDVRHFIYADDAMLQEVVESEFLEGDTYDETAYNCMCWVQDNISYSHDPQFTQKKEEWLFPTETLQTGQGDCEDGANLVISLMRNAGIPAYKVRNACGLVEARSRPDGVGGHSWPIYLRETDDEWVILDWCYRASKKPIEDRLPAHERSDYIEMEFTFNDRHSWVHSIPELPVAGRMWK